MDATSRQTSSGRLRAAMMMIIINEDYWCIFTKNIWKPWRWIILIINNKCCKYLCIKLIMNALCCYGSVINSACCSLTESITTLIFSEPITPAQNTPDVIYIVSYFAYIFLCLFYVNVFKFLSNAKQFTFLHCLFFNCANIDNKHTFVHSSICQVETYATNGASVYLLTTT